MSKLSKILLAQMALSPEAPYWLMTNYRAKRNMPPKNNGKPTYKVFYYTDKNGKIRRTKMELENEK